MKEKINNVKSNKQFMILSAIGIILVVICHLAGKIKLTGYIFPYTSFFMSLFIFISGYFYNEDKEKNVKETIWKKFKKLMIPFFIINLCYGILGIILRDVGIINYGRPINLYTLFVQPFINNSQYVFNFPSWFVPVLFVTYVVYLFLHKYANKLKINDYILLVPLLIGNIAAVSMQEFAKIEGLQVLMLKILFFLPFFHIGYLYKKHWQKYEEKIKTVILIPILVIINIVLIAIFKDLNYNMHEFLGFHENAPYLPIITSITGILFWLRISKILVKWLGENKLVNYISNNTFSIMSHHIFAIFIFDIILYFINIKTQVPYFNLENFKNGWIYIYEIPGLEVPLHLFYIVLGVGIPILMKYTFDKVKNLK